MSRIHLSGPDVGELERKRLLDALDSGWIAPVGPDLDAFEVEVAAATERAHAVALVSGSSAIHLALADAGLGPGDHVLVSTFTYAGSVFPVVHCGATPVFIDSEADGWNLSPDLLAEELADRRRQGLPMPKAAVITDLYGQCADYDRIQPLLDEHGILLVEDAAEAIGARLNGRAAGSFGWVGVLSFNGNKIVTTSGGGALLTDDQERADRYRYLATQAREPGFSYEHVEVGYSYRLSNLLAALGRAQLEGLHDRIARRRQIRERYHGLLQGVDGVGFQPQPDGQEPNFWLTCVTMDPEITGRTPEEVRRHLEEAGIESRPAWKPMHLQPVFAGSPRRIDGTSERIGRTGLCLPSGNAMSDADLERVLERLGELF